MPISILFRHYHRERNAPRENTTQGKLLTSHRHRLFPIADVSLSSLVPSVICQKMKVKGRNVRSYLAAPSGHPKSTHPSGLRPQPIDKHSAEPIQDMTLLQNLQF